MQAQRGRVRVQFLADLRGDKQARVVADLAKVGMHPDQVSFSLPALSVLQKAEDDPSRRTFAILSDQGDADPKVVGLGVLQPDGADSTAWPTQERHRFAPRVSVDARWQGQGIGTPAVRETVVLAQRAFPAAHALVLTVHKDNMAGQRTYERNGFAYTGRRVAGRAGEEYVMVRRLDPGESTTPTA